MQYSKFNNFYHYETKRLHENSTAEGFQTYSEKPLSFETGIIYLNIQIKYIFLSNLHVMVSMTVQEMNLQMKRIVNVTKQMITQAIANCSEHSRN